MSKLLTLLSTGALALTLGGIATAADNDPNSQQPSARQPNDPPAGGATVSQRDREYLAALKKCEALTGVDKTKCVESAGKKYGQM